MTLQDMLALLPDDPRERIVLVLSIAAGVLQFVGYGFAIVFAILKKTMPHPLTWLMFAYGTAVIFLLEYSLGIAWPLLILPAVCALCSLFMVAIIAAYGGFNRKIDALDWYVLGFDVALTVAWGTIWLLMEFGVIGEMGFYLANVTITFLWTMGVATSFNPMVRDTRANPEHERSTPWLIWTTAYCSVLVATIIEYWNPETGRLEGAEYLAYPLVNLGYHFAIGILAMRKHVKPVVEQVGTPRAPVARPR